MQQGHRASGNPSTKQGPIQPSAPAGIRLGSPVDSLAGAEQASGLKMKRAILLTVLLASALAFGQKFEVTDLSATDTPVSFSGTAKVSKTGTTCVVTAHNNSTQSLLAVEITGEVTSPEGSMQSTGLSYEAFFEAAGGIPPGKEAVCGGIPPGEDFDLVGPDFFDSMNQGTTYSNGVEVKPQPPKKDLVCHADFKVQFVQLDDGSTWGDYQIYKDVMARRAKYMAISSHLVDAYDTGGEAAFAAALDEPEPESRSMAYLLKGMAAYFKIPLIDLARKRLAAAQKRHASGIF